MRGIVLAGGAGNRLYPLTQVVCRQLLPVYDKPMIYYPLSVLMLSGIREVLIISTPKDTPHIKNLLGSGEEIGMKFSYCIQAKPSGLPEAFILGESFIGDEDVMMILGDNLLHGSLDFLREAIDNHNSSKRPHAQIFGMQVDDPTRFGVVEFEPKTHKVLSLVEKPTHPRSPFAIPGLYIFDKGVSQRAKTLSPSSRGETEIVDLLKAYLHEDALSANAIPRGVTWFDAGTHESLLEVSSFIAAVERRQGLKIGCLHEIAARRKFISLEMFAAQIDRIPESPYKAYLQHAHQQILLYPDQE